MYVHVHLDETSPAKDMSIPSIASVHVNVNWSLKNSNMDAGGWSGTKNRNIIDTGYLVIAKISV